jgi:hypothetical protein
MNSGATAYRNAQAPTFDAEPEPGLLDPMVRDAWVHLLRPLLPPSPSRIVDLGCGTDLGGSPGRGTQPGRLT